MLIRLRVNDSRDTTFDCGNDDLNEFFFQDSAHFDNELMAVTYVWIENSKVTGFFSVSNDTISRKVDGTAYNRASRNVPNTKRFKTLPAVKIGRLAVHKDWQGKGLGSFLLNYIKYWFTNDNKTGCRFIVVDAVNVAETVSFYEKNEFKFLSSKDSDEKTRLMFFDLMTIKQ